MSKMDKNLPDIGYLEGTRERDLYDLLNAAVEIACSCKTCFLARQLQNQIFVNYANRRKLTDRKEVPEKRGRGRPKKEREVTDEDLETTRRELAKEELRRETKGKKVIKKGKEKKKVDSYAEGVSVGRV